MAELPKKATAKMVDWTLGDYWGSKVLFGLCTEHSERPDLVGRRMHSSTVVRIIGNVAETLNTFYTLGEQSDDRPAEGRADTDSNGDAA